MTDTQRNVGITIVAILLLWWVTKKKKEEVLGTAEAGDDSQGGGGLGGFGGGLGILNITPPTPPVAPTTTPIDPLTTTTPASKNPSGTPADPNLPTAPVVVTKTAVYRDGMALRNFQIQATNGIVHNITKGKILKIADVGGASTTHAELNPKVSLRMGVDVDYASSATGSIPTGGIAGGLPQNTGIPTGKIPTNTGGVLGGNPNPSGTPTNSSTGALPTTAGGAIKL